MIKDDVCIMQPDNLGLQCFNNTLKKCKKCGWNPEVAAERRRERLEKEKGNKDD